MIAIRGADSAIAQELAAMLPNSEVVRVERYGRPELVSGVDRYLFCQGLLRPKTIADQTAAEAEQAFWVNCGSIMVDCDRIIAENDSARICVIGSESGIAWSFDGAYAAAKAGLHRYIETKKLRTTVQQLICISPSIIVDSGMTERRLDQHSLARRAGSHPKGRFLWAAEVAAWVHFALYSDAGAYASGIVIRLNGGEHTCR